MLEIMNQYIIGLDIGGTKCAVLLAQIENGVQIKQRAEFPTNASKGYEQAKDRLFETVRAVLAQNHLHIKQITAFGVSCGGPLDGRRGVILSPPNLPGWDEIYFTELLQKEFGIPAFMQNDANACALVEWKLGAGRGTHNMMFLTMGTGFGGGVICEDVLMRGANDMGGEIGHIRLEADGPVGFGKAGSVEGFCSGAGIAKQACQMTKALIADGHPPKWITDGLCMEDISAKVIAQYADGGDEDAKRIYAVVGEKLGKALSIFIDAFNPEMIVIGSIFVRSEALLRPSMEKAIEEEALIHSRKVCRVVPAQTGEALGDLASIMTACYELGIDVTPIDLYENPRVITCYERLFERYPALIPIRAEIMATYEAILRCYKNGGKLLVCGNGGSAADADHIVGELMKGFFKKRPLPTELAQKIGEISVNLQSAMPAISLTQHNALSTAFLNDVDPQMIFAQQVLGYGKCGDIFLGISTSGNSQNIIKAATVAKALGLKTITLTGQKECQLDQLCDISIKAPATITADIQEYHLPIYHTLCGMLEEAFFAE